MYNPFHQGHRGAIRLLGTALLLSSLIHAQGAVEDDCLTALGYSSGATASGSTTAGPKARSLAPSSGTAAMPLGACLTGYARENTSFPIEVDADFVPVTGDDALGFFVVYGPRLATTGAIANNAGIFLFPLDNDEILVFGSGYGDIPGINPNDAAFDMGRVDAVIQSCMGGSPTRSRLRMVVPHGHGDHVNPACNRELKALGYTIVDIAFHQDDLGLVNNMAWTSADRATFNILQRGPTCESELLTFGSPLGKIWFYSRPGHTDGSIDLVIDVQNDVTNRFLVRGSQAGPGCAPIPGVRDDVGAHGNCLLKAVEPSFSSLAPMSGSSLGNTPVTVTGTGFLAEGAGLPDVLFGGDAASNVVVLSDSSLTCNSPAGPAGQLVSVSVVTRNGQGQLPGNFAYTAAPSLTGVTPSSGDWRGGTTIFVTGAGFANAGTNEVFFGSRKATNVLLKNDGQLTCRAPQGSPGTSVAVLVRNANGQAFLPNGYRYEADLAITDMEPRSGPSLGGSAITLTGFAFTGTGATPAVTFGGLPAASVTLINNTTVTCVAPAGTPGTTVTVSLTNSVGTTQFNGFRYHAVPSLASVTPAASSFLGGTTVTLAGAGFQLDFAGTNLVTFGGVPATDVVVVADGALTCKVPGGAVGATVDVRVQNQNGSATLPLGFHYGPGLVANGLLPLSGSSLGGATVTINGLGFLNGPAGTTSVLFGGVAAGQVTALDDGTLTCTAPAGAPGAQVDVTLANANGQVTLAAAFRYHATPALGVIAPNHGNATTPTPVALTGSGFQRDDAGPAFVVFGGVAASDVAVIDDTTLLCVAPVGTPGALVDVILVNQNGTAQSAGAFRYHTAPTLTALVPPSSPSSGGARVTITGSGFQNESAGTNTVLFGNVAGSAVSIVNDTTLRVTAPTGTPGALVDVRVGNARGTGTMPNGFRFHAKPALTSVTPAAGNVLGGTPVTLKGTGFLVDSAGTNSVLFGTQSATGVVVVNDTTLQCQTPPGVRDTTVAVTVANLNGSVQLPGAYTYSVAAPTLVSLAPVSGPAAGGGSIQVQGTGFTANSPGANTVRFGATASGIVGVIDDQTLSCQVPAGTPGTKVDVSLSNTNGQATLVQGYRYHALPAVTALTPSGGAAAGGTTVTLTGSGFQIDGAGANVVTFGGFAAADVVVLDDQHLTCSAPGGSPGAVVPVVVTNVNGASVQRSFSYFPPPTLSAVAPEMGPASGGTRVTLTGTGFQANQAGECIVRFGLRSAKNVLVLGDTTLQCDTPRGLPGFTDVSVSNANGTGLLPLAFHYGKVPPTITGISPASGSALGKTAVTLTGEGFLDLNAGLNRIKFGAAFATDVVVVDDRTLICSTPAGTPGAMVDLALANNRGTATAAQAFRYHAQPVLAAIDPARGSAFGKTRVTLTGSGFTKDGAGANRVTFGLLEARDVVVLDDTRIACTSPGGTPGALLDIKVSNANGTAELPGAFVLGGAPPRLTAIAPDRGSHAGGTLVNLLGRGYLAPEGGVMRVLFGAVQATDVIVVDDGHLTCRSPAGTIDTVVSVTVRNKNGQSTLLGAYTYESPAPELASLTPGHGPATGGTAVQILGGKFLESGAGVTSVTFGGLPATAVQVANDSSVTCVAPPGTPGATVDVVLANQHGNDVLPGAWRYHLRPTLGALAPAHGPSTAGTTVTLTGNGFTVDEAGTNVVRFGQAIATNVVAVNNTTLTCVVPAGTPGASVDVTLTNANGQATKAGAFRYHAVPTLTAVAPAGGPSAGGTAVTLTGSGFVNDEPGFNLVTFGGVAALDVIESSDTSLTCTAPPGTAGATVDVVLINANGAATKAGAFRYRAAPTLTAVNPNHGRSSGGTSVTVTGTGFQADQAGTNTLTFGGVAATAIAVTNDTTLTCVVPAGTAGALVNVVLGNANGGATLVNGYRYHARPQLTSLSPTRGPAAGGTTVSLTGKGFQIDSPGTNTVLFGGTAATSVTVVSDTTITCVAPAGAASTSVSVSVANANGSASLSAAYAYTAPPTLLAVAPDHGTPLGGTNVTLTGTGFVANSAGANTVTFDNVPAVGVLVIDDATIACQTPPGTPAAAVTVRVSNANGAAQRVAGFTYHPAPQLTGVTPGSGPAAGGTTVTLVGSGFAQTGAGGTFVIFGGMASFNLAVIDDTHISCEVPAGTPGALVDVAVVNENGVGTKTKSFRYHALPTLTAVSPSTGSSVAPTPVTLTGTGFQVDSAGPCTVTFGALAATNVVVQSNTSLTCSAPPAAAGTVVDVRVTNANGAAQLASAFNYSAPAPTLGAVAPSSGTSLGGTVVTLTGTGFQAPFAGAHTVTFGGVVSPSVTVLSNTSISCTTPPGTVGALVAVGVSNANGSASLPAAFTYSAPPPTLTAVAPATGSAAGGTLVTLTGTGFQANAPGTNTILFGAAAATNVAVVSDTTLTCSAPGGTPGAQVAVRVTNANGFAELPNAYRFNIAPTLSAVSPASGTSLGGTLVTLTGTGFQANAPGTNAILFGATPATSVSVTSDTTLTCRAPSGASGAIVNVSVTNANGAASLPSIYRYHARPAITGVTPTLGSSLGGTKVTLNGTGFKVDGAVVNIVSFGGVVASSVTTLNDTTIECNTPAGTPDLAVQVTVANVNGTALLGSGFRYNARPTLLTVAPDNGPPAGGTTVVLTGSGFLNGAAGTNVVTFGGTPASAVAVIDDTSLSCATPPGVAGSVVDVVLTNGNGSAAKASGFTYQGTAPVLAGLTPAKGTTQGATPVTLTGDGFDVALGASVTFGGEPATGVTLVDEHTLTCLTPPRAAGALVDVSVQVGSESASLGGAYQYLPPPTLLALEPPVAEPEGGVLVTLTGSGFLADGAGEITVTFDDVPLPTVNVVSDEALVVEVPAGPLLGEVDVAVRNEIGEARLTRGFRWQHRLATDLNRDGRGDLVVTAPGSDAASSDAGAVHVFLGSALPRADRATGEADLTALPVALGAGFGEPVAAGDLDGDGVPELVVSAPRELGVGPDAGAVYVFAGPLAATPVPLSAALATTVLRGASAGERFGATLHLGDLNRDGVLDLVVGAPGDPAAAARGAVLVYLGSAAGLSATPAARLSIAIPGDGFGLSLASGDLDGDGWPELFVGAPLALGEHLPAGSSPRKTGVVRVFHGGPELFAGASAPWAVFSGTVLGERFGGALAARDLTGDGRVDLVVGAPSGTSAGTASGTVYAFRGRDDLLGASSLDADARLTAESAGDRFGSALSAGDVDGDGLADLLVGAPGHTTGRAYLFLGGTLAARSAAAADAALAGEGTASGDFGSTVALVDVDGDGLEEMVVGAPTFDAFATDQGRVYVFRGTAVLVPRDAADDDATLTGGSPGDKLGRASTSDH